MKKVLFTLFALVMVAVFAFTACSSTSDNTSQPSSESAAAQSEAAASETAAASSADSGTEPGKVFKIGVSTQAWKHEFLKNFINAFKAIDEQMDNVELILVDSEDDVQKQLDDVDTLIAQGVDGIILNPLSFEGTSAAVQACKEAGITVVEAVSYTQNEDYATFVGTDVKASGLMAGKMVADMLGGKGKVFEIEGIIGHTAQINRGAGIKESLAEYPDIQLVETQCGEFDTDVAMQVTDAWLTKYDEIDAIVAHNDGMALGAMNACITAGRTDIKIVGIDGDLAALNGIIAGTYSGTCVDYCEEEAKLAVEEMVSILSGNAPKGKIIVDYVPVTTAEEAQKFVDLRS
jgi:inositol transport system substrate-binding protein